MKVELRIGDGRIKPKVVKCTDGTYVIEGDTGPAWVAHARVLWMRTFLKDKNGFDKPVDGKGFLVGPTGKITKG